MKRHFLLIVLLVLLLPLGLSAKNKDNDKNEDDQRDKKELKSKKMSDYVDLKVSLSAEAEVGLADMNNEAVQIDIGICNNKPDFKTSASVFAKILFPKHKNLILGPVGYTEIEGKMTHHKVMTSSTKSREIFYFKKGEFFNYAGIKIGTDFGTRYFDGSSFTVTIPFMFDFLVNDANDALESIGTVLAGNVVDYYTHLLLGTNLIAHLKIKSKPLHLGFGYRNSIKIAGDVCNLNSNQAYQNLFITQKNDISFDIKPFNFINNKVDVDFTLGFKSKAEFTGDNLELTKKAFVGISWDGLKYFGLRYKPFIYADESDYQFVDVTKYTSINDFIPYYKKYSFSTEFGVFFGNQYFNLDISYELPYYVVDGNEVNTDLIREHTIKTAIEVKF